MKDHHTHQHDAAAADDDDDSHNTRQQAEGAEDSGVGAVIGGALRGEFDKKSTLLATTGCCHLKEAVVENESM
jgi:hypothetical protein